MSRRKTRPYGNTTGLVKVAQQEYAKGSFGAPKPTPGPGNTKGLADLAMQQFYPNAGQAPTPNLFSAKQTFDPAYERQKTDLQGGLDNANAFATYGEGRAASDYGFSLNRDPSTGFATAGGIDTSNPFAKMSLLQRSYETSKRATSNQYASMGQGFSGAFNNQQADNTFGYQQGYDSLTKEFADILRGLTQDRLNAQSSYSSGLADADLAKIMRLVNGGS